MVDISGIRTLSFVGDQERLLLGYKKRGFGVGRWNGFGGKVEPGETILAGAERELQEEAGVRALASEQRGILEFSFTNGLGPLSVHVFWVSQWEGEALETEEMMPRWFAASDIPYEQMWIDDIHWLPHVLAGKYILGQFHLGDTDTLLQWTVKEVAAPVLSRHV